MSYSANDVIRIRKASKLTQSQMAKMLGVARETVNRLEKGTLPISKAMEIVMSQIESDIESLSAVHVPQTKKVDRRLDIQDVPLYEHVSATAGVVELFGSMPRHVAADYIRIPDLPKCDGAIKITGDSMYPLLKSGDMVLYKVLHDKGNIIWGEMYLVAVVHNGDEFVYVKYLHPGEVVGYVRFVSQNEHHKPVEFPMDSIVALALVKASVRFNSMG
jgi:phage repressor protein C with HTH and peptisase S24 domain